MFINNKALNDFIGKDIYKEDLGVELVNAMYNFESPYELDAQMLIVKQITTDSVFNDLTIDNEQRTLTTYLKFKDCSSKVHIIDSTDRYIRYWLESDVIEADREFVLFFLHNGHRGLGSGGREQGDIGLALGSSSVLANGQGNSVVALGERGLFNSKPLLVGGDSGIGIEHSADSSRLCCCANLLAERCADIG